MVESISPFDGKAAARALAGENAIAPGLAEAAAHYLGPGEKPLWAGRGSRSATFLALLPAMILISVGTGIMAWLVVHAGEFQFRIRYTTTIKGTPAETLLQSISVMIGAFLLYCLFLLARSLARAGRDFLLLTDQRLVEVRGREVRALPLLDVKWAEARRGWAGCSLVFQTRGTRGSPGLQARLYGVDNIGSALAALEKLGIMARDARHGERSEVPQAMVPGEAIRWRAHRGWRALDSGRQLAIVAALVVILFCALALVWVWQASWAPAVPWYEQFLFLGTVGALSAAFGPVAYLALRHFGSILDDAIVDMFGSIVVTDRRILFLRPLSKRIDRQFPDMRLVAVDLIDKQPYGRGYIVLLLRGRAEDDPQAIDLFGVPDAEAAAFEMSRLVRQ